MNIKFSSIFFYSIVFLSTFGLIILLVTNPMRLISYLLVSAVIIGIIVLIMRKFAFPASSANKDQKAFVRAARQSKKRQKKTGKPSVAKKKHAIRKKNTSNVQLTVIEGKKGKKRNRALH